MFPTKQILLQDCTNQKRIVNVSCRAKLVMWSKDKLLNTTTDNYIEMLKILMNLIIVIDMMNDDVNDGNCDDQNDDLHQMTRLLSVTGTAPAGAIGFSLLRLWFRLVNIVFCCAGCCVGCRSGEVWSDRKEAEESGNITAVNIKKSSDGGIGKIRIR